MPASRPAGHRNDVSIFSISGGFSVDGVLKTRNLRVKRWGFLLQLCDLGAIPDCILSDIRSGLLGGPEGFRIRPGGIQYRPVVSGRFQILIRPDLRRRGLRGLSGIACRSRLRRLNLGALLCAGAGAAATKKTTADKRLKTRGSMGSPSRGKTRTERCSYYQPAVGKNYGASVISFPLANSF